MNGEKILQQRDIVSTIVLLEEYFPKFPEQISIIIAIHLSFTKISHWLSLNLHRPCVSMTCVCNRVGCRECSPGARELASVTTTNV